MRAAINNNIGLTCNPRIVKVPSDWDTPSSFACSQVVPLMPVANTVTPAFESRLGVFMRPWQVKAVLTAVKCTTLFSPSPTFSS